MAAFLIVLLTSLLSLTTLPAAESRLYTNYYQKSCPRFAQILQDTVTNKQIMNPTTAAASLRFHDCLANGYDASILLSSTPFNKAMEKLGVLGIQTGRRGEIRHRCRYQPLIEQRSRNYSLCIKISHQCSGKASINAAKAHLLRSSAIFCPLFLQLLIARTKFD